MVFGLHVSTGSLPHHNQHVALLLDQMKKAILQVLATNPKLTSYCINENSKVVASSSQAELEVSKLLSQQGWEHEQEVSIFDIDDIDDIDGNDRVSNHTDLLMHPLMKQMFALDMANRCEKVGIEFDGPFHFVKGTTISRSSTTDNSRASSSLMPWEIQDKTSLNGRSLFKKRLLKALGWKVVHIHYKDWSKCKSEQEKRDYLCSKVAELYSP